MKTITCNQRNKIEHHFSLTKLEKLNKKLPSINQRWYLQPGMLDGSFLEAVGQYFLKSQQTTPLLAMQTEEQYK